MPQSVPHRRQAAICSFSPRLSAPSPDNSPRSPETSIAQRSLGDKLQLLALTNPDALMLLEIYVDRLLA